MYVQGAGDHRQNAVRVAEHFVVPESQQTVALAFDRGRAGCVELRFVLAAIHLNDQPRTVTGEISDEVADRDLAAEAGLGEVLAKQTP